MATTYTNTNTNPGYQARSSNNAIYWGVAIAVVLGLIIYFATRNSADRTMATPATTTAPAQMGTTPDTTAPVDNTNSASPSNENEIGSGSNKEGTYKNQSGQTNVPSTSSGSGQGRQ